MRSDGADFIAQAVECVSAIAMIVSVAEFMASNQIDGNVMFQQRDVGMCQNFGGERFLYGMASGIGGVDDTSMAVAAFACQVIAGIGIGITCERHALRNQPVNCRLSVFDNIARGGWVTEASTGGQGILDMRGQRIFFRQHGCDSTLCPNTCTIQ